MHEALRPRLSFAKYFFTSLMAFRYHTGGVWHDKRGSGFTADNVKALVAQIDTIIPASQQGKFEWYLTVSDQGNFEFKMMASLWFLEKSVIWTGNVCSLISSKS